MILDTGVVIKLTRNNLELSSIVGQDDVALSAISLAELLFGIEYDSDPVRQARNNSALDQLLAVVPIEDYTARVAPHHAELLAHTRRAGRPRSAHDLIIAATARATDRTLLTTNSAAGFDDLPGVTARVLPG